MRSLYNLISIAKTSIFFGILAILLNVWSCVPKNSKLESALFQAGENRAELERVLAKYSSDPADSLEYKAACFLIENMIGKFAYQGDLYFQFLKFIDFINNADVSVDVWKAAIDSFYIAHETLVGNPDTLFDIQHIKSDFLINNIDQAFFVYRNAAWCSEIAFEDFCEYILPYRYGNEPLEDFRAASLKRFGHLISDKTLSSQQVADSILKVTSKQEIQITTFPSFVPSFSYSDLSKLKIGTCDEVTALAVLVMRSLGLCVAQDFTPQWPHRAMGHSWAALLLPNGLSMDFEGSNSTNLGGHLKTPSFRMAKAYRRSYRNLGSPMLEGDSGTTPAFFLNPNIIDVTDKYLDKTDIVVNVPKEYRNEVDYSYLCVFNNRNWIPIHFGRINKAEVTFSDMGRRVVYLPVIYRAQEMIPIGPPMLLDSNGMVKKIIPDENKIETVYLKRKYPVFDWWNTRTAAMMGARFQAANNPKFTNAKDLYVIDYVPEMSYQEITIDFRERYKYFRYLAPDSTQGNIAEVEVYGDNGDLLKGRVIGSERATMQNAKERVFDGEPLTYFEGVDFYGNWVGLEFNNPEKINKIRFLCRNDDNFIRIREIYELFYWQEGGWRSLGSIQGSTTNFLRFDNVPQGSLLLLRNLTKGKEERIFTYEDGQQIWW